MTANPQKPPLLSADEVQSRTIYFLRFLLILAVVFTHARIREPWQPYQNGYSLFVYIFTGVFERLPALVLFSGYLFFRSGFSTSVYARKLKSRIKSLLVPYLFWNAAVVLFYVLLQTYLLSRGQTPDSKLIADYTPHDWIVAFWNGPIAPQFWFIRNLMMVMVLSPVFYLLLRYLKLFGLVLTALPWLLGVDVVWRMHTYTFFFFSAGAWFALRQENFVERLMPHWKWSGLLFLLTACVQVSRYLSGLPAIEIVNKIGLCASVVFLIAVTGKLTASNRLKVNIGLCQSSFFVFATHFIPVGLVWQGLIPFFPENAWSFFLVHMLTAGSVILFCIGLYRFLHRFTPRFLSVITGGR